MREKYNATYLNSINTETSYIHRYLGAELETVLNPETNSIHGIDFDSMYVNMPSVESKFTILKSKMDSDRCLFLTGLTGCGKSSLLNYTFHTEKNIHIENRSLYITFSFDHAIAARDKENIETYFKNQIKNACDEIKTKIDKSNLYTSNCDLYKYIKKIRPDALQHDKGIERGDINERLEELRKQEPLEYYALTLKYYLTVLKDINHVVLIVDDIESVGYQMELVPIDIGLSLWSCLKNQPKDAPKVWSSCIVISCRHYVYRMILNHAVEEKYIIQSRIDSQTLESYPINDEVNISKPVKLSNIIEKRVQALSQLNDNKRWNDAWEVVEYILIKTDDKFGDFITAICINNLRKALAVLKEVVFNKKWIQRNWFEKEKTRGAFNIKYVGQYNISPPCLLRAISLGEGNTYDENSIIPNILMNTYDANSDLITLIVLKAFMNQSSEKAIDWRTSLNRYKITENLKIIIQKDEIHQYIDLAVEHLIKKRLFLRSKNCVQDDGIDITEGNIASIEKIYVSRAAFALWNQLGRSSILLELFTDDIYIEYKSELIERLSFPFLFDARTFEICIGFVSEMIEVEKNLRIDAKNKGFLQKMNSMIGSEFVTKQLLNGLISSRNAYYKTTREYEIELNKIVKKIDNYKNLIANI